MMRFCILFSSYLFLLPLVRNHAPKQLYKHEVLYYRDKVASMFYHGYENYLKYATEYDELQPITCSGVNTWGSFSLTLIDSLDTLAIMGNYSEFRRVAQYVVQNLNFNHNINVSVFETNIRVVGGLLSAHLLSHKAGFQTDKSWPCDGPLLRMADSVARKLLPAFETKTGMPYGTVNLMHGVPVGETAVTCTAGVGTFILEFAALSRLTGDPIFESKAMRALDALHKARSSLDLVGNHINTNDGKWTATESTIGGGVDSFFEYLVKGSMLLQKPQLMEMFKLHHSAIEKYMLKEDWYLMVQMSTGSPTMPIFQSLEAFWPGLLSLMGQIGKAQRSLYNYHQVWKQFGFLPEFYDIPSYDVKRSGYPLRPEFAESIFYVYKATQDPHLRIMAVDIVESIERSAKTECGYATVKDVKSHTIEDRMESFFLGETLKYLYLIFDDDHFVYNDGSRGQIITNEKGTCVIDAGGYFFNTEAHPIDSATLNCCSMRKENLDKQVSDFLAPFLSRYFKTSALVLNKTTKHNVPKTMVDDEQPQFSTISPSSAPKSVYDAVILEPSTSESVGEPMSVAKTDGTILSGVSASTPLFSESEQATEVTLNMLTDATHKGDVNQGDITKTLSSWTHSRVGIEKTESPEEVYSYILQFINETMRIKTEYPTQYFSSLAPKYEFLSCPSPFFFDRFSRFGQVYEPNLHQ